MEIAPRPGERTGIGRVTATPGSAQGGYMNYLFASYTLIWLLLFAYVMSIGRRQKKVQDDLSQIQEWMDRQKK
jgi:CcmD family protein